ncbi:glycosyltransferase involved in cell wall biosynthesis [Paeniglutamicibacter sulfureus]|uniref:Glycosyltransferase involved in cell wall biosynthesis n=1 Tax=Paeniglutamicibacter sulfureus TaxID=43666 RepID=A0ABU2BQ91_9MICC|nr:glycosyltransferase involved in cell wall biosynthesis [Paeniglutamicibacter sulfureus]
MSSILWLTEWLSMKVATDVLFVSQSLAREADSRRLLSRRKSWVIGAGSSNGVDARAVEVRVESVNRDEIRVSLDLNRDDFVVGFIGRIARDKGLETLVHAFSEELLDSRVRLLCIGAAEDENLTNMVRALGDKVRFVPWTNDVWGYLPALDVLCLPTLREGFPNVVLEAAAAGIPAITTRATGAIDSVVDDQTGFLIDVGDADALVEKINLLAGSQETAKRLGSAAKQRVLSEFQQERIWQGIAEILSGTTNTCSANRIIGLTTDGENK